MSSAIRATARLTRAREARDLVAGAERSTFGGGDHRHRAVPQDVPALPLPDGTSPLVGPEQHRPVGRTRERAVDPSVAERVEVRQDGDAQAPGERVGVPAPIVTGHAVADQRPAPPAPSRPPTSRRARRRLATPPRSRPRRASRPGSSAHPRIAADQVEEPAGLRRARRSPGRVTCARFVAGSSSTWAPSSANHAWALRTACAAPCRAPAVASTNAGPPAAASTSTRSIGSFPGGARPRRRARAVPASPLRSRGRRASGRPRSRPRPSWWTHPRR